MGFESTAVLAYGYDLRDTLNHTEEDNGPLPAWATDNGDLLPDALRTLYTAAGGTPPADGHVSEDDVRQRCGITLTVYGDIVMGESKVILTAKTIKAALDTPEPVDLYLPPDVDQKLAWALTVLGFGRPAPRAQWLLAASDG